MQAPLIMRPNVITALIQIREDWEVAADGDSLVDVRGSVGMLFGDIVDAVGLTYEERCQVLGENLSKDLNEIMSFSSPQ
jgi:hypothetical protein